MKYLIAIAFVVGCLTADLSASTFSDTFAPEPTETVTSTFAQSFDTYEVEPVVVTWDQLPTVNTPTVITQTFSQSCANGSCGPVQTMTYSSQAQGPIRRVFSRRPIRGVFGRLFGRFGCR